MSLLLAVCLIQCDSVRVSTTTTALFELDDGGDEMVEVVIIGDLTLMGTVVDMSTANVTEGAVPLDDEFETVKLIIWLSLLFFVFFFFFF